MRQECYYCHIKTVEKLTTKFKPTPSVAEDFIFSIHNMISNNWETSNPQLATMVHRIAKQKLDIDDLYSQEKKNANTLLLANYEYWRSVIDNSKTPFYTAAKLAVVGNIIDYGAHSLNGELEDQIHKLFSKELRLDFTKELKKELSKAKSVLYLGDNAGEIFFDRLFIETFNHSNVTFAVRGAPVINDVTEYEAKYIGIDKVCNSVISNGYDAPSTLLDNCSDEFLETYKNADLIISKGQGNFEGLMNEKHPNTFFMLIAKCNPMAEMLGVNNSDMVIVKRSI